jgi:hypothetical protein
VSVEAAGKLPRSSAVPQSTYLGDCHALDGVVSSYTIGGFIHILLVVAIAVVLIRLIQGRSVA